MNISRFRTYKVLVALGAISLALVAAGPASAADNTTPPTDQNGKKYCKIVNPGAGTTSWVPHGTERITEFQDGSTQKEKCDDGGWVVTITRPGGSVSGTFSMPGTYSGSYTYASGSGTTSSSSRIYGTPGTFAQVTR